ncbi:MAG TPA: PRC-barrel domain-containing protein [Gemmatimonadales bacterium]
MSEERRRLAPLGDTTEFRVAAGLPDVRGWMVLGGDGTVIGRVVELLVDRDEGRVRYLECTLAEPGEGRGRIHVPVGLAHVRADRDEVEVPSITVATVNRLVRVHDDATPTRDEDRIRRSFADVADGTLPAEDEWYDERRFVERRRGDVAAADDQDFAYLAGVGGAMTDDDESPEVVGEVDAGQIRIPVMEEETSHAVAPEDGPGGADAALADEPAIREELRRHD